MASAGIWMQSRSTQKKIHISVLLQTNTATKTKSGGKPSWKEQHFYDNVGGVGSSRSSSHSRSRFRTASPLSLSKADNWQCPKGFLLFPFSVFTIFPSISPFFPIFCEVVRETGALASRRRRRWRWGLGSGSWRTLSGDISLHISMFSLAKLDLCFCCSPRICIFNVHLCLCVKMPHGAQKGNPSRRPAISSHLILNPNPSPSPNEKPTLRQTKSPTALEAA